MRQLGAAGATRAERQNRMKSIELLHNDDELLDPADSHLMARGSILVDGSGVGAWAQRDDGVWKAWVREPHFELTASSQAELERLVAERVCRKSQLRRL